MAPKDNIVAYFEELAKHLCGEFASVQSIENFTKNTDVIGAYAETLVGEFVRRTLHPLRVSCGTIISPAKFDTGEKLPQIDLIVWDPNPIPAIFDQGGFALVPKNSVIGTLEVKRTDYSKGLDDILDRSTKVDHPGGLSNHLGVICVRQNHKLDGENKFTNLLNSNRAIYLIDYNDSKVSVNPPGVIELVNFLARLRKFHKKIKPDSEVSVQWD